MAGVNQVKLILFIFCIFILIQSNACETKRQARLQENTRSISSEH